MSVVRISCQRTGNVPGNTRNSPVKCTRLSTPSLQANSNEILCICCIADFVDFGGKSWNFGQSGAVSSVRGTCRRHNLRETHRRSPSEPYAPFGDVRGHPGLILGPESSDFPKFAHFELLAEGTVKSLPFLSTSTWSESFLAFSCHK